MKIVHVIPALTKGGAERVVVDLANHAAEQGHQVTILAGVAKGGDVMPADLSADVELRFMREEGRSVRSIYPGLLPWILGNREWLFSRDVVHCHLTFGTVFGTLLQGVRRLFRRRSPAIVETYHGVGGALGLHHHAFSAFLLGGRDAVAFMAEDDYWGRFRSARPKGLFRTIPNGIAPPGGLDPAASERFRAERTGIPRDSLVVGSVGRLVSARRPDLLLAAFVELSRVSGQDVHLLLAGQGPEADRLSAEARSQGLGQRVHLPGLVLDPREPFGVIDLYLTINVGPVTGIAAIEAAFAGLPIIALQLRPDYVAQPDDWIWSTSDPRELGQRAAALLADRHELRRTAAAQHAVALATYNVETMARSYFEFYEAALGAG